ncbi:MAG: hypothetical protein ACKVVP_16600 [Chloroflexota bacterium]
MITRSGGLSAFLALALAVLAAGTMFADDDNDKKRNNGGEGVSNCGGNTNNCADQPSGSSDANRTSGEVIAINTLVEPHEIILGNTDGRVVVKLYGKEAPYLIKSSGIKVRDYIEVIGYKEHENLFWADSVSAPDDNSD